MGDVTRNTDLQSILEELSYLSLRRSQFTIETKSQIGAGGYGEVLLAKLLKPDEAEVDVAVKCVWAVGTMGDRQRFARRFVRELKIWASIRHLNVLPLVGFYLSDNYEIAQLVSPFMANGNVTQYIFGTKPGREKRFGFICDIAAGIDFLHNHSPPICHGDLKPANVLVSDSYEATLCDFGLASLADMSGASSGLTTSQSMKGSIRYMSPELMLETDGKHTLASDVWAWACTAFEILTDRAPYSEAKTEPQIMLAILREEPPGAVGLLLEGGDGDRDTGRVSVGGSRSLLSSVSACWSFYPAQRPTMREIVEQVFPTWDRNSARRGLNPIGSVRVRTRAFVDSRYHSVLRGTYVRVMINGVCYGVALLSDSITEGAYMFLDVVVDVNSFREVVVLEAVCGLGGTERILGRAGIGVRELAIRNSSSIFQSHRYAFQRPEGQVSIEYNLEYSQSVAFKSINDDVSPNELGSARSASSGARTFYTAASYQSEYQMSIPGGFI